MRNLAEPGMLQRLLRGDPLSGIVNKNLLEKVQELSQEFVGWGYDILEHCQQAATTTGRRKTYR
jgi:hypothetical protein